MRDWISCYLENGYMYGSRQCFVDRLDSMRCVCCIGIGYLSSLDWIVVPLNVASGRIWHRYTVHPSIMYRRWLECLGDDMPHKYRVCTMCAELLLLFKQLLWTDNEYSMTSR